MRRRLLLLTLLGSLCVLLAAPSAGAELMLHVRGSKARMQQQTGQRSDGTLAFWDWKQGWKYGLRFHNAFPDHGPVPVISLNTAGRYGGEAITMGVATIRSGPLSIQLSSRRSMAWRAASSSPAASAEEVRAISVSVSPRLPIAAMSRKVGVAARNSCKRAWVWVVSCRPSRSSRSSATA